MALASFFTEGPSLLAKTATAAVNPVSSGPSTIFSLLGQCWHFNYCWVNSFAPVKAVCPNRICRLHDLWTCVTQDTIGAKPSSFFPALITLYYFNYSSLTASDCREKKHTRENEWGKNRTVQLDTVLSTRLLTAMKRSPSDIIAVKGQSLYLA